MELPSIAPAPQAPRAADVLAPCPNCRADRLGAYCAACGQHALDGDRLTFRILWREFAARTLNFDVGLLYTIRSLFSGPGRVALRYVQGERRRFTSPITFLAICCAFYLILFGLYKADYIAAVQEGMRQGMAAQHTSGDADLDRFAQSMQEELPLLYAEFMIRNTLYLSILTVIPVALAYRLFFGNARPLPEIAVLLLYVQSMLTLITMATNPLFFLWSTTGAQVAGYFNVALGVGLAMWGVAHFYGRAWWQLFLGGIGYLFGMAFLFVLSGIAGMVWAIMKIAEIKGLTLGEVLHRLVT